MWLKRVDQFLTSCSFFSSKYTTLILKWSREIKLKSIFLRIKKNLNPFLSYREAPGVTIKPRTPKQHVLSRNCNKISKQIYGKIWVASSHEYVLPRTEAYFLVLKIIEWILGIFCSWYYVVNESLEACLLVGVFVAVWASYLIF